MTKNTMCLAMCLAFLYFSSPANGQITYTGLEHSAVGGATLDIDPDGRLRVSNLGSSGDDGVSIALGGINVTGGATRLDGRRTFGVVGDSVTFNPLATAAAVNDPPSITIQQLQASSYSITVGSGGNGVFLDLIDADGGVLQSLPVSAAGPLGNIDSLDLESLFAIQDRSLLKTYFETGDIPTEPQFSPHGGGAPIPGVYALQLRYPETELEAARISYATNSPSSDRGIDRTFAKHASVVPGGLLVTGLGSSGQDGVSLAFSDNLGSSGEDGVRLALDNLGSSGEDGVSLSFGDPDLSGGEVAGVRVDKFEYRQQYGQTTGGHRSSVHGNPLYGSSGATGQSAIYEGSINGNASGGVDFFFEIGELNTDQAELRVSQLGNPLVNEVVIGLADKTRFATVTDVDSSTELLTTMTSDTLRWSLPVGAAPASITTNNGQTVQLTPGLPLEIEIQVVGSTNTPAGFGRVDLQYADVPGGVLLRGFAIPEPATVLLVALGVLSAGKRSLKPSRNTPPTQ